MLTSRRIRAGAVDLQTLQGPPAGPAMLFLHGVLRDGRDFLPVLPLLHLRWQVALVDHRGHGGSSRTPGHYFVRDYLDDAVALLDSGAIETPAVVFGHSLGAMVALGCAASRPDLVSAIILEDPPFRTMGEWISRTGYQAMFRGYQDLVRRGDWTPASLGKALGDVQVPAPGTPGETVALRTLRDPVSLLYSARGLCSLDPTVLDPLVSGKWMEDFDWMDFAANTRCPALLLRGSVPLGGALADEDHAVLAQSLPDLETLTFSDCGHLIHGAKPEEIARVTTFFLESRVC